MKRSKMILENVKNSVNSEFIINRVYSLSEEIAYLEGGLSSLIEGTIKELEIPSEFRLYFIDNKGF